MVYTKSCSSRHLLQRFGKLFFMGLLPTVMLLIDCSTELVWQLVWSILLSKRKKEKKENNNNFEWAGFPPIFHLLLDS